MTTTKSNKKSDHEQPLLKLNNDDDNDNYGKDENKDVTIVPLHTIKKDNSNIASDNNNNNNNNSNQNEKNEDEQQRKEETGEKDDGNDADNDNDDWKSEFDTSKRFGDDSFRSGKYVDAIRHYTAALSLDPDNAVVLSNRSASYLKDGQKSNALHDAQICVRIGTMGIKGYSRLAAAQQSLGRYEAAIQTWKDILQQDPQHVAAKKGVQDCTDAIEVKKKQQEEQHKDDDEEESLKKEDHGKKETEGGEKGKQVQEDPDDLLNDFFNEVNDVTAAVQQERIQQATEESTTTTTKTKPTNAIKNQKKDLGTVTSQIDRILQSNYKWLNLNPYHVLDIPHTSTKDEVNRRYKALSLLLHPDKNLAMNTESERERIQDAYDQVLAAKAKLDDDDKANHIRQLIEQGMKQGKMDYDRRDDDNNKHDTLHKFQSNAIKKIFAQIEYTRLDVEQRKRNHEQRLRQQEQDELSKERNKRKFDISWKQDERVEKRIGNWRDFQHQNNNNNSNNKKIKKK